MILLKYWRRDYYKYRYWKNWQALVAPSVNFDFKTIDPHALTTRNLSIRIPSRGNMESFGGACSLEKIFNNTLSTTTDSNYCGFKVKSGATSPYSTAVELLLPFADAANNNLLHITKVTLATRPNDNFSSTLKMGVRRWTSATDFVWEQPITGNLYQTVTTAAGATNYTVFQGDVYTDWIYFDFANCSEWFGVQNLQIIGEYQVDGTEGSYDRSETVAGIESNYDYYIDTQVNPGDYYTHTTETQIANGNIGGNLRYGRRLFGRWIYAGSIKTAGSGGDTPSKYLPGAFQIIAYNADGTKSAIFGAGANKNAVSEFNFKIIKTGCGECTIKFNKLPTNAELNYKQRIDIHLFNDDQPWFSGYVITRPIVGTTETSFSFVIHGFYNLLEKVQLFETYENMEVSAIVKSIAQIVESKIGLVYNADKIINTGYTISKIVFDGVDVKKALEQLSDFGLDYVFGVDEKRSIYFKPRNTEINEQARFWVGKHLTSYVPNEDVEKVCNWARIKGAALDATTGESWLTTVQDLDSQAAYGLQEEIWTLPSAYVAADAERWGNVQIQRYKDPIRSAKIKGVDLRYLNADGSFNVRKLSTDGECVITTLDGFAIQYPITSLKYSVSPEKGIQAEMELGEQPFRIDTYFAELERNNKNNELLQQASNKQLI